MKKYCIVLFVLLSVLSCKKSPQGLSDSILPKGETLRFEASLADTKVHFANEPTPGDPFPASSSFEWDEGDAVAIYSIKTFADYEAWILNGHFERVVDPETGEVRVNVVDTYTRRDEFASYFIGSEICPVQVVDGSSALAKFSSSQQKTAWIDTTDPNDQLYLFVSYYPAPTDGQIIPFKFFSFEGDSNLPFFQPYIPVEIPAKQDGVNYQKYQIMLDSGIATEDVNVWTKEQIMTDNATVSFNHYVPYTSILNFRLKLAENEADASIDKIEISIFSKRTSVGDYEDTDDTPKLAGKVLALISSAEQGYGGRLWYHPLYPGPVGNEKDAIDLDSEDIDATNTLTIKFTSPLSLTDDEFSDYVKAVVLPSYNEAAHNYGAPQVLFKAYDASGNLLYMSAKYTNSTDGFEQGKRYNFDVVLYPNADFEAGNAGSYSEIIM